jgi:ABC-type bacteriocin/lantibiotic exporter with double-glycine peptidase domain
MRLGPGIIHRPRVPTLKEALGYFWRLLLLIRPYWIPLAKGIVLTTLLSLVSMITPYISKLLIDQAYPSDNFGFMHVLVLAIFGLAVASTVCGAINGFYSLFVSTHLNSAARLMYFNHLQHLDVRFFDQHRIGEINSRFQDVATSLGTANSVIQMVFTQGVYLVLVPPLLMWIDLRLSLVALAGYPLTTVISTLTGKLLRRSWKRSAEANADLSAFQIETLSNIRTFKAMAAERFVLSKTRRFTNDAVALQVRASGLSQLLSATNGLIRAVTAAAFTWYGWGRILSHELTLGDFMAFSAYIGYLYRPISQMVNLTSTFQQSAVSLYRVFEYLDYPVEQDPSLAYGPPTAIARRLRGQFRFEGVSFSYVPDQKVVSELDMEIPAGRVTALVGASGCGKTTVLRLLLRFADPQRGRILVDGTPLQQVSVSDVRRQMAIVWQEVGLIKGTLWDNLTLGVEVVPSLRDVEFAVDACELTDVVERLPKGYQTEIAEWGSTLSAGQRQRIALARALLRNVPVVLLDEATANVDAQTESRIFRKMFGYLDGRTIVVVTHRVANAALADLICVLHGGRVVGSGPHEELRRNCRLYGGMVSAADECELTAEVID